MSYILFFTFYFLAFGITLVNAGLFWDEWVFYKARPEIILSATKEMGALWFGYFHIFLDSFNSIFLYRLVIFSTFFISGLFLNSILKTIKQMDNVSRFFVVAFFMLFPVNFARISIATSHYALSYSIFFFAWFVLSKYFLKKRIFFRLLSLSLFFISFSLNSLLVFYGVVIMYIIYVERSALAGEGGLLKRVFSYLDFLSLPISFWIMKVLFFKPYGLYSGYNHVSLKACVRTLLFPADFCRVFYTSFIQPLNYVFPVTISTILLAGFTFLLLMKSSMFREINNKIIAYSFRFFLLGILFFILASFPYLVVGSLPKSSDWASRNQILIPLGASLILYYGLQMILNKLKANPAARILLFSLIIVIFISLNSSAYLNYQKDWFKQLSLIENFKSSEILKSNTTFIFADNTLDLNAGNRDYRFYEYTGMMEKAFGDESRFGINFEKGDKIDIMSHEIYIKYPEYKMSAYEPKQPDYKVLINYGSYELSNQTVIKLLWYSFFNQPQFQEYIKDILTLDYVKI